jgi:riboflavin kinase / FMN adenylyltransferase
MSTMQVIHGHDHVPRAARGAVLAIGNFDGVHRGHQVLLARAKDIAKTLKATAGVLAFDPHPRTLFQPDRPHFRLTSVTQRIALFQRFGMDLTVVLPFNRSLAELSAEHFIERVLVAGLGIKHAVIGYDFHFGKGRGGSPASLAAAGQAMGFGVTVVDPVAEGGEVVSSSAIRAELAQGDVEGAAALLGHAWRVSGEVQGGAKRGTGMGYPTANIGLAPGTALAHGIYAVKVHVGGKVHDGAAYLGTRPTFDNGDAVLETFLLDFDGDLYGKTIELEFIGFIRGDRKFDSMDALVAQMDKDVARTREVLKKNR